MEYVGLLRLKIVIMEQSAAFHAELFSEEDNQNIGKFCIFLDVYYLLILSYESALQLGYVS